MQLQTFLKLLLLKRGERREEEAGFPYCNVGAAKTGQMVQKMAAERRGKGEKRKQNGGTGEDHMFQWMNIILKVMFKTLHSFWFTSGHIVHCNILTIK